MESEGAFRVNFTKLKILGEKINKKISKKDISEYIKSSFSFRNIQLNDTSTDFVGSYDFESRDKRKINSFCVKLCKFYGFEDFSDSPFEIINPDKLRDKKGVFRINFTSIRNLEFTKEKNEKEIENFIEKAFLESKLKLNKPRVEIVSSFGFATEDMGKVESIRVELCKFYNIDILETPFEIVYSKK